VTHEELVSQGAYLLPDRIEMQHIGPRGYLGSHSPSRLDLSQWFPSEPPSEGPEVGVCGWPADEPMPTTGPCFE
jgi:hypothetical protein